MSELKNCPVCNHAGKLDPDFERLGSFVVCSNDNCRLSRVAFVTEEWQRPRPIEAALQKRIDELEKERIPENMLCLLMVSIQHNIDELVLLKLSGVDDLRRVLVWLNGRKP